MIKFNWYKAVGCDYSDDITLEITGEDYSGTPDDVEIIYGATLVFKTKTTTITATGDIDVYTFPLLLKVIVTTAEAAPVMTWEEAARLAYEGFRRVEYICSEERDLVDADGRDHDLIDKMRELRMINEDGDLI